MKIYPPLCITSRLLPGIYIGGAEISIEYAHVKNDRLHFQWYIDLGVQHFSDCNLAASFRDGRLQGGLESLLGFLATFAERIAYEERTGEKCKEPDLFPLGLAEWAAENVDEINMLQCTLMDKPGELIEE